MSRYENMYFVVRVVMYVSGVMVEELMMCVDRLNMRMKNSGLGGFNWKLNVIVVDVMVMSMILMFMSMVFFVIRMLSVVLIMSLVVISGRV